MIIKHIQMITSCIQNDLNYQDDEYLIAVKKHVYHKQNYKREKKVCMLEEELPLDVERVSRFIVTKALGDKSEPPHDLYLKHFIELVFVENLCKKLHIIFVYNGQVIDLPSDPKSPITVLVPFIDLDSIEPKELKNQIRHELRMTKCKNQEQLESTSTKD